LGYESMIAIFGCLLIALPVIMVFLLILIYRKQKDMQKQITSIEHENRWIYKELKIITSASDLGINTVVQKIVDPVKQEPQPESEPEIVLEPEPEIVLKAELESEPVAEPEVLESEVPVCIEPDAPIKVSLIEPKTSEPLVFDQLKETAKPAETESSVRGILVKIWNWIIVGEEHRPKDVSAEFAIASNWLLRIGIIIVVMAIGFFLKYSIETGLLTPMARVSLSILSGLVMLSIGTRLFSGKYILFAQGLTGGGIAVLYFSFFSAFYFHGFISQLTAFLLMILVTITACILAVRYDSLLTAVFGLLGGYGTPFMLSTGDVNYPGLLGYLLLLGVGIFVTASRKNWRLLNYIGLVLTYILTAGTLSNYDSKQIWQVLPFIAGFFILFSTITFIHNLLQNSKSTVLEVIYLNVNAMVFFIFGYKLITGAYQQHYAALLSLFLSAFYIGHIYYVLEKKKLDRILMISFIALASFFLTITIPIAISGEWISVIWAMQALVMLWLGGKLRSRFLEHLAFLIYLIVMFRFFFVDLPGNYPIFRSDQNQLVSLYLIAMVNRFITFAIPIASFTGAYFLIRKETSPLHKTIDQGNDIQWSVGKTSVVRVFISAIVGMLFFGLNFEFARTLGYFYPPLIQPAMTLIWIALAVYLFNIRKVTEKRKLVTVLLDLIIICVMAKLVLFDMSQWGTSLNLLKYGGFYSFEDGFMRLLDFGLIGIFAYYAWKETGNGIPSAENEHKTYGWLSLGTLFTYTTFELNSVLDTWLPGFRDGGMSILWSAFALVLLFSGLHTSNRSARYVGLSLFCFVIAKVFFFDLERLDPLWRIVAFMILGILVLCGSFFYLKYKGDFTSDEETTA